MNRLLTVAFAFLLVTACSAWGQTCPTELSSPDGEVPFGREACSPDRKLKAREIEPRNMGRIGIFDAGNKQLREIRVGESANPLKALAWSPDSATFVVHYHHDPNRGYFALYDVASGTLKVRIPTDDQWNYAKYAADGKSLTVRSKAGRTVTIAIPQ